MAKWWKEAVVYQIYPRSFNDSNGDGIGDINGILEKLDYIKDLGVDVIWLSPVYCSPNDDFGYDISDYYKINEEFGTFKEWENLLSEAHKRGLRILMDLVINHTSDEHSWFVESRSSKDNPKRDYYIWRKGKNGKTPNNWQSYFSESAWEYDDETDEYYLHLFSKKQPDINWENKDLQKDVVAMIKWWLDKGIDGFRIDMVNVYGKPFGLPNSRLEVNGQNDLVFDPELYANEDGTHNVLQMLNKKAFSKYDIMTVGEAHTCTPKQGLKYVDKKRKEINMLIFFEHLQVDDTPLPTKKKELYKFLAKSVFEYIKNMNHKIDLVAFKTSHKKWYKVIKKGGWYTQYLSNHDQPRQVSRFGDDKKYRVESAKMLATILHTMPGTPFIYQGEEIGMTNFALPSIDDYKDIGTINAFKKAVAEGVPKSFAMKIVHQKSRDNARFPMQWDDTENAGFTNGTPWLPVNTNYSEINVKNDLNDGDSILNYYKKLIRLRKENPIVVKGDFTVVNKSNPDVFTYVREYENERWLVIANFTKKKRSFKIPNNIDILSMDLILSNYKDVNMEFVNERKLMPYQCLILKLTQAEDQ